MIVKFRRHPSSGFEGGHATVCVFVGPDGDHLAKAGDVVMRADEWSTMQDMAAPPPDGFIAVTYDDANMANNVEFRAERET